MRVAALDNLRIRHSALSISLVVLFISSPAEDPASERAKPPEHVKLVAEIHQLDQVSVKVFREEERVAARRALGLADAFDPFRLKVVVPPLKILDVERNVRQADAIPGHQRRRDLRLERKDLEHRSAWH